MASYGVSTHAPAWGATRRAQRLHHGRDGFNPRSRMGSDRRVRGQLDRIKFQPTLPHGERRATVAMPLRQSVSTHAPAWGATRPSSVRERLRRFQPTLPHGERPAGVRRGTIGSGFNPRSRMGSDRVGQPSRWRASFNPRSRMGSDRSRVTATLYADVFQPTLPHGERPRAGMSAAGPVYGFNPRSRMGSDAWPISRDRRVWFQPTLPHGERRGSPSRLTADVHVSTHAPAWGATAPDRSPASAVRFNPRSRMGSDARSLVPR